MTYWRDCRSSASGLRVVSARSVNQSINQPTNLSINHSHRKSTLKAELIPTTNHPDEVRLLLPCSAQLISLSALTLRSYVQVSSIVSAVKLRSLMQTLRSYVQVLPLAHLFRSVKSKGVGRGLLYRRKKANRTPKTPCKLREHLPSLRNAMCGYLRCV